MKHCKVSFEGEGGGEGHSLPKHMREKDLEQPWVTENEGDGFLL